MKEKLAKLIESYEQRLAVLKASKAYDDDQYYRGEGRADELEEVIADLKVLLDFN